MINAKFHSSFNTPSTWLAKRRNNKCFQNKIPTYVHSVVRCNCRRLLPSHVLCKATVTTCTTQPHCLLLPQEGTTDLTKPIHIPHRRLSPICWKLRSPVVTEALSACFLQVRHTYILTKHNVGCSELKGVNCN